LCGLLLNIGAGGGGGGGTGGGTIVVQDCNDTSPAGSYDCSDTTGVNPNPGDIVIINTVPPTCAEVMSISGSGATTHNVMTDGGADCIECANNL
jgi:hypothetical protein